MTWLPQKWWIYISFWWIHFYLSRLECFFSGEKLTSYVCWSPFLCSLLSTFPNYFLVFFKLFYSLLRKGWWYTSSIIDNNIRMCLATYTHPITNFLAIFSVAPSSSTVLSHCVSLNLFSWIPFLFFETFLFINSISLSFGPWAIESSVSPFILLPNFWFL